MNRYTFIVLLTGLCLLPQTIFAQPKRIGYNNQQIYLNGINLAWINYSNDVGRGVPTDTSTFGNILPASS